MTVIALCAGMALLAAAPQAETDRAAAIRLAHAGSHEEALSRFREQVRRNPADLEGRIWIAQLLTWTGRPAEAKAMYTEVLASAPDSVDALIGLGVLLDRAGRSVEALALLARAERLDPDRPDTLAALGRAHRVAGRTTQALAYFRRAADLAPADTDIRRGLETTRLQHGHRVETSFAYERLTGGVPDTRAGALEVDLRATDALRLALHHQVQRKFDADESRTGASLEWRVARRTRLRGHAGFSPRAEVLPRGSGGIEVEHAARRAELSGSVRFARFASADVWIAAPAVVVPIGERFTVLGRYFWSGTSFVGRGAWVTNHSAAASVRARLAHRLWVSGGYARGNESFETLSVERIGRFRADTVGVGLRVDTPRLASFSVSAEREHSDSRGLWRLTTAIAQRF